MADGLGLVEQVRALKSERALLSARLRELAAAQSEIADIDSRIAAIDIELEGVSAALGIDLRATTEDRAVSQSRPPQGATGRQNPDQQETETKVLAALRRLGRLSPKDISVQTGIEKVPLSLVLYRLTESNQVIRTGQRRGLRYSLPTS